MDDWTEDECTEWVEKMYELLDARDVEGFVTHFTPGGTLRVANGEPVAGRVAIRDAVEEFLAAVGDVSHAFRSQVCADDWVFVEAEATYTRRDGASVVVPVAAAIELSEGLAERMQVYADLSPVFAGSTPPALLRGTSTTAV